MTHYFARELIMGRFGDMFRRQFALARPSQLRRDDIFSHEPAEASLTGCENHG